MLYQIETIARIKSPFKQKFGIPRQPGLTPSLISTVQMEPAFSTIEAFKGIETYSHLWLLFLFHKNLEAGWRPTVRPPRLGGKEKMGVFATRCTYRPNGIGQSVVKFNDIYLKEGSVCIDVQGADLLDGTPIIDIKPYIQYSDAIPNAECGFAQEKPPELMPVYFNNEAQAKLAILSGKHPDLQILIKQILATDPRPAYRQGVMDTHRYGIGLYDYNIKWRVHEGKIEVIDIEL
jgi:tRNA-Thr(GGU) m(6)t(6)A37 methyltransferase TsaA